MQSIFHVSFCFKVFIVRTLFPRVLPQRLCCIELRGVRGKIIDLNPFSIFSEPVPDVTVLVVRSAILDVVDSPIIFEQFTDCSFQKNHVGRGVEDFVHHIFKLTGMNIDAPEHLY